MEDGSAAAVADERPSSTAIVTLPNFITLVRLACLPVFLWLLFGQENREGAAWLLAFLGITDWIDGYLARHLGQTSELGKVLDPVADRLLFFVGVGGILIDGSIPVWVAVAVLVREAAVAIGTLVLASLGAARIDVTWFGKAGTFALMFAVPFFLGAHSTLGWRETSNDLAWFFTVPGLIFSYYAALLYLPIGRRALAEGRAAREAAAL